MIKLIRLPLYYIFCLLFNLAAKQSVAMLIDTPVIIASSSTITGKIIVPDAAKHKVVVNITVAHPISGEYVKYNVNLDTLGKFLIDVDVETNVSLIRLDTSFDPEKAFLIKLASDRVTNINIVYNSHDFESVQITPAIDQVDITKGFEALSKMITNRSDRAREPLYNKGTDYFLNYARTVISERLKILDNYPILSNEIKEVLSKEFRVFMYSTHVMDYKNEMILNHRNTTPDNIKSPDIQKIDKSYFRFLKDFKLNDPQYLLSFTFHEFQTAILQNETLALPSIGEKEIPTWLASVKTILSDLVGFAEGPYYDILAANAYARQLNEELRPLTEKQKANISDYWKDGEIAKILLRKNRQVVELDKLKFPVVVNDISLAPNNKLVETILAKHKGKVVFIDLWATWCGPCLEAMKQFRTTKGDFHDKKVAFVYLTNGSSPRKLWEEKIKGIGSEHYYLKNSQWEHLMTQFGFEGIPSYLLYNREGVLIKKFTAFPGEEKVREMINELL